MAKMRFKRCPKPPKKNASIATKEAFLRKVKAVKEYNRQIMAMRKRSMELDKQIAKAIAEFRKY